MAKINTTSIQITVSELVKEDAPDRELLSAEVISQLEHVITQLASEGSPGPVLVEVAKQ